MPATKKQLAALKKARAVKALKQVPKSKIRGEGKLGDFLKKAHTYVKDKKLISGLSNVLAQAGVPGMSTVHKVSSRFGYGARGKGLSQLDKGLLM